MGGAAAVDLAGVPGPVQVFCDRELGAAWRDWRSRNAELRVISKLGNLQSNAVGRMRLKKKNACQLAAPQPAASGGYESSP